MINKLHNDNADCSDLNYLHEQYESYEKCSRVYKYKCQISFPPSSLLNQTLRCNTVIVKQFLNTGLNAEDVGYKSLITDQYVFKAYG